ncbi:hypothetical protein HPP92_028791 [Vanilla planifolia]|uniref:Uncharacterized protein n=1 Tax=Vanilla planifolia TaxID=51239 RepID=A0A835P636_VANPL|nr:hypothetical protein HPP92_028791 [Vanilla planifolia]KAG0446556.1 hypothetical protein HPP92_028780 [Vanilla planifolia]
MPSPSPTPGSTITCKRLKPNVVNAPTLEYTTLVTAPATLGHLFMGIPRQTKVGNFHSGEITDENKLEALAVVLMALHRLATVVTEWKFQCWGEK